MSLLRGLETADKQVGDEEIRELMKENGIGHPFTRASIIETLFRRQKKERNKKQILHTEIGVQLTCIIKNNLLSSAKMTGQWEKQLKKIEKGNFRAGAFVKNMKIMMKQLVFKVIREQSQAKLSQTSEIKLPEKEKTSAVIVGRPCPKCKEGALLIGKASFG